MNSKKMLPVFFVLSFLLSVSGVFNLLQYKESAQTPKKRSAANALLAVKDTRRIATLIENNTAERYITIAYSTSEEEERRAKLYLTENVSIQKVVAKETGGITEEVSVEALRQKDLEVNQPLYTLISSSPETKRLETSLIIVGDILPATR